MESPFNENFAPTRVQTVRDFCFVLICDWLTYGGQRPVPTRNTRQHQVVVLPFMDKGNINNTAIARNANTANFVQHRHDIFTTRYARRLLTASCGAVGTLVTYYPFPPQK